MAVSRTCLNQIGALDEQRFGRGYGEENDFCLRATAAGWRHVAATRLFVWHRGSASFGDEREALVEVAQSTLESLHPGYAATVGRFIRDDPLGPARQALDIARIRADPRRKRLRLESLEPSEVERRHESSVLDISLVPDLPPYAGQHRLVPKGLGAFPNLPRYRPGTLTDEVATLLLELGIEEGCAALGTLGPPGMSIFTKP